MTCSLSLYLLVAGVVGVFTSTVTGSDGAGWTAAGAAVLVTYLAQRWAPQRFGATACDLPTTTERSGEQPG